MRCPNMKNITRGAKGISRILPVLLGWGLLSLATEQVYGGWEQVPEILDRISAPMFPNRDFTVTDYGALGNGQKDCTEAMRKAISAGLYVASISSNSTNSGSGSGGSSSTSSTPQSAHILNPFRYSDRQFGQNMYSSPFVLNRNRTRNRPCSRDYDYD